MSSVEIVGHSSRLEGLWRAAHAGRLAHALLFEGQEGIGKFLCAQRLAAGLLCAHGPAHPCGECGPCKRVAAGTHPDLMVLDPTLGDTEHIAVDRIRADPEDDGPSVGDFLTLRASENGWRIVLIREAHRLNLAAQNALLKTLEEPGQQVLFVLETSRPDQLLATTLSRCVRVRFEPLNATQALRVLAEHGCTGPVAAELVRWSAASPGLALELERSAAPLMHNMMEQALLGQLSALAASGAVLEIEASFPGKTPAARERSRARRCLDLFLIAALDAERYAAGQPLESLRMERLAQRLARVPQLDRARCRSRVLEARADLDRNLSGEACIERLFLELSALRPRAQGVA